MMSYGSVMPWLCLGKAPVVLTVTRAIGRPSAYCTPTTNDADVPLHLCLCISFPLCPFYHRGALVPHSSSKASWAPHQRVSYPPCLLCHLLRDGDEGCFSWLPNQPHPCRAAPAGCPCITAPLVLAAREEEEKGGNRARKTSPGFLHPQEISWTHTRLTTSLLNHCCPSCKNHLSCWRPSSLLWDPAPIFVLRSLPRAVAVGITG